MVVEGRSKLLDEQMMRVVFATIATLVGITTIATRDVPALDWSLTAPTVVAYWAWALLPGFPALVMYIMGLTTPLVLNIVEADDELSMFFAILTASVIAAFEPVRGLVVFILGTALVTTFVLGLTAIDSFGMPNWLFGMCFAWGFGELAFRYTNTIDELEHARSLMVDQAALHERRRIARDVHDLVGHSLSVVMLHVTGARHLVRKDPAEAERALAQAEAAGRESLAEVRRTVAMLREDGEQTESSLPSPDLNDVQGLVDDYLLGGVDISLDTSGDLSAVDAASGLAGFRIIQEALTNIARHTIGCRVTVSVDIADGTYDLAVRNADGDTLEQKPGAGFGLVSMRERAKSVGGLLVAGPTPDGWLVEATLPVSAK